MVKHAEHRLAPNIAKLIYARLRLWAGFLPSLAEYLPFIILTHSLTTAAANSGEVQ